MEGETGGGRGRWMEDETDGRKVMEVRKGEVRWRGKPGGKAGEAGAGR